MTAARVLVVTEDDDVGAPLETLLRRAGHRVEVLDGREAALVLAEGRPDVLVLDRDLPPDLYERILDRLAASAGPSSFPLIVLGGGTAPGLPKDWHEDASASVARPPAPGEILATIAGLLRLVFYRRYRDLVHDLSQPVTTLHALSRSLARRPPADEASRAAVERLAAEAERLMTLLEDFQRGHGAT